ncbi:MAG: metallophosphoesterase [Marinilabiliales bacterium]|nr:metallophosphoesterase [Marinilabiliales bacterium]
MGRKELLKSNPCKWTIMTFHHPIFSTSARRDNKVIRELFKPLIDKYGVDMVLTGHDHTYARGIVMPDGEEKTAGRREQSMLSPSAEPNNISRMPHSGGM